MQRWLLLSARLVCACAVHWWLRLRPGGLGICGHCEQEVSGGLLLSCRVVESNSGVVSSRLHLRVAIFGASGVRCADGVSDRRHGDCVDVSCWILLRDDGSVVADGRVHRRVLLHCGIVVGDAERMHVGHLLSVWL